LNQNNRNNNRRRGRGNNRGGQGGGGSQGNRIDSRARGNAPQMLEKYRKLAHDASLNGDRVQTEYYLQFADHYFRVIADMRTQKDEPRPRREEREQNSATYDDGYDYDDTEDSRDGRGQQPPARREDGDEPAAGEGERGAEADEAGGVDADDNPFTRDTRARGPRTRGREKQDRASGKQEPAAHEAHGRGEGVAPRVVARVEPDGIALVADAVPIRVRVELRAPVVPHSLRAPCRFRSGLGRRDATSATWFGRGGADWELIDAEFADDCN